VKTDFLPLVNKSVILYNYIKASEMRSKEKPYVRNRGENGT